MRRYAPYVEFYQEMKDRGFPDDFIKRQYEKMMNGNFGVEIHDDSLCVWNQKGGNFDYR